MRPCHAILLFLSTVCVPVVGHCETVCTAKCDATQMAPDQQLDESVPLQEDAKAFRGFFGYLEYDFAPDKPVPGFDPLPHPAAHEIAQAQIN